MYIPDNYDMFVQHQNELDRQAELLPRCSYCDEPIFDEYAFEIDGSWYHKDCFESEYLKLVE